MSEDVQDYTMTYSLTKLEETARTFRRLAEAYNDASQTDDNSPGFSRQLFLVADILDECMTIQLHPENIDRSYARELIRKCMLCGIKIKNIQMLKNHSGKNELVLVAKSRGHACVPARKLSAVVTSTLDGMYYPDYGNQMVVNEDYHQFVFVQEDRFRILTGVARHNKAKEHVNGDNFLISKLQCGKMVAAISDGMGSGKRAFVESRLVIELMENCIEAGFEEKTSIDLINSAYIAGGGIGNPVTIDMSVIDCQAGILNCIKLGAVSTFIKRENCVEIIKSTTLPIGVLEQVDYDCTTKKLYDGDYVVMVSDGILENIPCVDKEQKMAKIISAIHVKEPKAIAAQILKKSLSFTQMKAMDDCTVLVTGVFDTYEK